MKKLCKFRVGSALRLLPFALLMAVLAAPAVHAQSTGLIFTPKDELLGIPIASTPFSGAELPAAMDLSADLPPPGNQGRQRSCVGWAVAYALKSFEERIEEKWPLLGSLGAPAPAHVFSPSFVYNQINNGRDGGCSLPAALNLLHEKGAATLAEMPYNPSEFKRQPDTTTVEKAKRYRIDFWRQVNVSDPREIKAHLNAGFPVVIGADVDQGFAKAGAEFVWKSVQGKSLGGHAMILVGYDDRRHAFKLLNSWGRDWGDGGYGWIDYDFIKKVVNEAYVAKDALNGPDLTAETTPPAPAATELSFQITSVVHNVPDASGVLGMRLEGTASIPPGMGRSAQVVAYFYFDAGGGQKGWPVRDTSVQYSDVNGFAATGTPPFSIPAEGTNVRWWAVIPYDSLVLQPGGWASDQYGNPVYVPAQTPLVLEPVLSIDGFGVARGSLVPFLAIR